MDENSAALTVKSDIRDVIIAANTGDENALSILREQLKDELAKSLLKRVWGMASQVEMSLLNSTFGDLLGSRELVERQLGTCLLYTSPSPRDLSTSRMPSSA